MFHLGLNGSVLVTGLRGARPCGAFRIFLLVGKFLSAVDNLIIRLKITGQDVATLLRTEP